MYLQDKDVMTNNVYVSGRLETAWSTWASFTKERFLFTKVAKHFLQRDDSGCRSIHLQNRQSRAACMGHKHRMQGGVKNVASRVS